MERELYGFEIDGKGILWDSLKWRNGSSWNNSHSNFIRKLDGVRFYWQGLKECEGILQFSGLKWFKWKCHQLYQIYYCLMKTAVVNFIPELLGTCVCGLQFSENCESTSIQNRK